MIDTSTEKRLQNLNMFDNPDYYRNLMKECTKYAVTYEGQKFWLAGKRVMVEWKNSEHAANRHPFETWNFKTYTDATRAFKGFLSDKTSRSMGELLERWNDLF